MTTVAGIMAPVLGSAAAGASADAAPTDDDVLACMADADGSTAGLKAMADEFAGDGHTEDWEFLLDAIDALEHPPASDTDASPLSDQNLKYRPDVPQQPQAVVQRSDLGSALTHPSGLSGEKAADAAAKPGPGCCSPGGSGFLDMPPAHTGAPANKDATAPRAPAASTTVSGDADSNSAVAAAGWHSSAADLAHARFSWAEDNSPLLSGHGVDPEALATFSGGTTHSPGSAGGAHSSAGPVRLPDDAAADRTHSQQYTHHLQQQQQQPTGRSSHQWGSDLVPAMPSRLLQTSSAGLPMAQNPPAFSHSMMQPASASLHAAGAGLPSQLHTSQQQQQQSQQQQQHAQAQSSNDAVYLGRPHYQQPLDFLPLSTQLKATAVDLGGGNLQASSTAAEPVSGRLFNQFAVPGSPLSGSPLSASIRAAGFGGDGLPGTFNAGHGMRYSLSGMGQPQGRTVVTGRALQQPHSSSSSRTAWPPATCPCCPPGQNLHNALLPSRSAPMMPSPHAQLPGFSPAYLNPDWRGPGFSGPMLLQDQALNQQLPAAPLPHFQMAQQGTAQPALGALQGHRVHFQPPQQGLGPAHQHMGSSQLYSGTLQHSGHLRAQQLPPPAAAHSVRTALAGGGVMAGPTAAGSVVSGGQGAEMGEIHPAALSQYGVPEESFPVLVGPPKRKRGRPRKHPLPEVAAAATAIAAAAAAVSAVPTAAASVISVPAAPGVMYGGMPGGLPPHLVHFQRPQQQQALHQQHIQLRLQHQHAMLQQAAVHQRVCTTGAVGPSGVNVWGGAADGGGPQGTFGVGPQDMLKRQKSHEAPWSLGS